MPFKPLISGFITDRRSGGQCDRLVRSTSANAMRVGRRAVSLPLSPKLTDENVEQVVDATRTLMPHTGSSRS